MLFGYVAYLLLAIIVIVFLSASIRILREYQRGVVFTLGRFTGVKGPGLIILIPFLQQMVKELRKGLTRTRATALNQQLQTVEGEADKKTNELLRGLYNATENPGRVLFLKDIYELLEKVTDRCRDAGNVITQIVLKNA